MSRQKKNTEEYVSLDARHIHDYHPPHPSISRSRIICIHTHATHAHSLSLATSGRPVTGQGRPSFPTILSQAYIYYETHIYVYAYTCVWVCVCVCAYTSRTYTTRARAEPARVENYVSDTFARTRTPLKSCTINSDKDIYEVNSWRTRIIKRNVNRKKKNTKGKKLCEKVAQGFHDTLSLSLSRRIF